MTVLIDTHAHLDFPQFKQDREAVLERAVQAGVGPVINVGTGEESSKQVVELAKSFSPLWAAVGVHPHFAAKVSPHYLDTLSQLASSNQVVAIGETGLDFYRNLAPPEVQEKVFREHLRLAAQLDKPVIIHSRQAHAETYKVLQEEPLPIRKGVMHCFSGDKHWADAFLGIGFYLSIAGPLTYPRSHQLRELLKQIPRDRLLLETDAPYLSPQPYRSLRNEPAFIRATYERAALTLGINLEQLAEQLYRNAQLLFKID